MKVHKKYFIEGSEVSLITESKNKSAFRNINIIYISRNDEVICKIYEDGTIRLFEEK